MGKKHHILFVASWYPNRNQPVLGNFIARHAQAASITNSVSVVAAFSDTTNFGIQESHSGNLSEFISYFPKVTGQGKITGSIRKVKAYRNALRETISAAVKRNGKPDIIHVHVAWPVALAILPVAEEWNIPVVLTEHWSGYLPEDGNYRGYFLKRYTRKLFAASKAVTVVSERMKNAMIGHGLDAKFRRLPNTVDTSIFKYTNTLLQTEVPSFLHVSMLVDREKNITGLLHAFAAACKISAMQLTIVGDGPERAQHEETATRLGITSFVNFLGLKNPVEIAALMNESTALVMFSNFEGMPVTIIEAQCCGLPVIATNTGAIPEMLNNTYDLLIAPGKENELTEAFTEMKSAMYGIADIRQLRSEISSQAHKRYSMNAVSQQLNAIYEEVLSVR